MMYYLPDGTETHDRMEAKQAWIRDAVLMANEVFRLTRMPNETFVDLYNSRNRVITETGALFDQVFK